jgi:hypothetical protein
MGRRYDEPHGPNLSTAERSRVSLTQERTSLSRVHWLHVLALTCLLAAVGISTFTFKISVLDLDLGWHLKTGDWIIQHFAVPHNGLFTWTAADHPWAAYSWGYEVLLSRANAWFGLTGIALYGTLLTLGVTYSIYWMARRLSGNFWIALLITIFSCSAFLMALSPRPVFFSMILFCVTLTLLLEASRSGNEKLLYWLPLVFFLWANLHIQFIYGLFAVGLMMAVNLSMEILGKLGRKIDWVQPRTIPAASLMTVFALCVFATCLSPYSYHLYGIVTRYAQSKVAYHIIMELQPVNFSVGSHYVTLLWMAFAFFAVGRQKKVDQFKFILLCATGVIAFRTMRDSWFICISGAACIADAAADAVLPDAGDSWLERAGVAVLLVITLAVAAWKTDFNDVRLEQTMAQTLPVNAVNYLKEHPARGPLYNTMDWGGFLAWYLPEQPVSIDGRTDLYGDQMEELSYRTAAGAPSYINDPYLNAAGVVLLQRQSRLWNILENDARFQLVYQDGISAVFVRK